MIRSPSTGLDYDPRTSALLNRLGTDLTQQDFVDLAVACADRAGLSVEGQIQLVDALNACGMHPRLKLLTGGAP